MKVFIALILLIVIAVSIFFVYHKEEVSDAKEKVEAKTNSLYQGPVPQGYDLNHFRKTGETRK